MKKGFSCLLLVLAFPFAAQAKWLGCFIPSYVQTKDLQNAYVGGSEKKYIIALNQDVEDTVAKLNGPNKDKITQLCLEGSKDDTNMYIWSATVADSNGKHY